MRRTSRGARAWPECRRGHALDASERWQLSTHHRLYFADLHRGGPTRVSAQRAPRCTHASGVGRLLDQHRSRWHATVRRFCARPCHRCVPFDYHWAWLPLCVLTVRGLYPFPLACARNAHAAHHVETRVGPLVYDVYDTDRDQRRATYWLTMSSTRRSKSSSTLPHTPFPTVSGLQKKAQENRETEESLRSRQEHGEVEGCRAGGQ